MWNQNIYQTRAELRKIRESIEVQAVEMGCEPGGKRV